MKPVIDEIRDAAALHALEPEWWELWRRCPAATPFQSPAWLLPWWDIFAPGNLRVGIIRQAGRLVAVAPFYFESSPSPRRLLPVGIGISDYLDVLLDAGAPHSLREVLADYLANCHAEWDACELNEVPPGAAALTLPCRGSWQFMSELATACPFLSLPSSSAELARAIPRRRRQTLATARNRAMRRGMSIVRGNASDAQQLLAMLIRLHEARWQSRGESGVFADSRVRRFHEAAVERLTRVGLLRVYALLLGGKTAAVYYGFLHRERAYFYLLGFDPADAFESPGAILIGHAIEEAVREGAREFHFLRGQERYKYEWGAQDRWNKRIVLRRAYAHAAA